MTSRLRHERELTGRTVLVCLLAFFVVVVGVNAVMVRVAISTFGGVETENAYRAGLAFNQDRAAALAQDARRWTVDARLIQPTPDRAELVISLRDKAGAPVTGVDVAARLAHPADARRDHPVALTERGPGTFAGISAADAGQWDLLIEVARNGERLFRSKSRIALR